MNHYSQKGFGYQPNKSLSILLKHEIMKKYFTYEAENPKFELIIHHVLVDSPVKLVAQIETRTLSILGTPLIEFHRIEL